MTITIPWPPSANRLWGINARAQRVTLTSEARAFYATALVDIPLGFCGDVRVDLVLHPPAGGNNRDPDNSIKAALDWLERASVIKDDRHCIAGSWTLSAPEDEGSIEATITPLHNAL